MNNNEIKNIEDWTQGNYRRIDMSFSVYVPAELNDFEIEGYINDKLETDPEFFGWLDQGCFERTNETLNYGE